MSESTRFVTSLNGAPPGKIFHQLPCSRTTLLSRSSAICCTSALVAFLPVSRWSACTFSSSVFRIWATSVAAPLSRAAFVSLVSMPASVSVSSMIC